MSFDTSAAGGPMRPQSAILAALEAAPATNGETAHDTSARRADGDDLQARQRQLQAVVFGESGPARADQPWLARLGLEPTAHMRQCGNSLVLPLVDAEGTLSGYVNVTAKGEVRLPRGSHFPEGCFFLIGEQPGPGQPARVGIVETLEDGLRHHDATGDTVLVAFSFRNMLRVRDAVQACCPGAVIQIVNRWNSPAIWGAAESTAAAEPVPEDEPSSDSEDSQPETAPAKPARRSAADSLLEQAVSRCTFFHDAEANGYGMFEHDGHWECHRIRGMSFRNWLRQLHFAATGHGMGRQALQDIIDALDARVVRRPGSARFPAQRPRGRSNPGHRPGGCPMARRRHHPGRLDGGGAFPGGLPPHRHHAGPARTGTGRPTR
jgi:hypothetical protein